MGFMIRAVGGEVSWDSSVAPGATYSNTDPRITHQLVDRDATSIGELVLGRFYVQHQWVFDSINRREKCPERDYALGETLPPHLSPFTQEYRVGDYIPPEQKALDGENVDGPGEDESEEDVSSKDDKNEMGVKVGMMDKLDDDHEKKMQEDEEYKLRVMMIKKKHRGLYKSMMKNRRKRMNESRLKERKRKEWDEQNSQKKKKVKKQNLSESEPAA